MSETMTDEEFFDQEIAPGLLALCEKCKARGVSFMSGVEFGPTIGEISYLSPMASMAMRIARYNFLSNGNFDTFLGAVVRDAQRFGHSSGYLTMMGVPEKPEKVPELPVATVGERFGGLEKPKPEKPA